MNKSGPSTEPWGTPNSAVRVDDSVLPRVTLQNVSGCTALLKANGVPVVVGFTCDVMGSWELPNFPELSPMRNDF